VPERLRSSIKPEQQIEDKPILKYNNKTWLSYEANGFLPTDPEDLRRFPVDRFERRFLSMVDISKGEIQRKVRKIIRLKAIDYNTKKQERKEYLVYIEDWFGKSWDGSPVPPVRGHWEGVYYEQERQPVYVNRRMSHYERSGQHEVHYIPFSKKAVDEIIESSTGTDIDTIKYLVKFTPNDRDDTFNYQQFTNLSFTELYKLHAQKGGPRFAAIEELTGNASKS
jgi:hypothetical protein